MPNLSLGGEAPTVTTIIGAVPGAGAPLKAAIAAIEDNPNRSIVAGLSWTVPATIGEQKRKPLVA
jgi:hypothetical protein